MNGHSELGRVAKGPGAQATQTTSQTFRSLLPRWMAEITGVHHCTQLNDSLLLPSFFFLFSFQCWELKLGPATCHIVLHH